MIDDEVCIVNYDYGDSSGVPQPGYIQAWCPGGKVETVTSGWTGTPPVNLTYAYKFTFETAARYVKLEIPLSMIPNQNNVIDVYVQKSATSMSVTPRIALIEEKAIFNKGGSWQEELTSAVMTDDTNWQTIRLTYNATDYRRVALRVIGRNGSGTLYWFYKEQYRRTLTT